MSFLASPVGAETFSSRTDDDVVATLNNDFLLNLLVVMLALIGGIALAPEARVAGEGAPDPRVTPVVVHLTERGDVHLEDRNAPSLDLAAYERGLAERAAAIAPESTLPVVIRLPERIPSGRLIEILNVSRRIPGVRTALGGRVPTSDSSAATDRSEPR